MWAHPWPQPLLRCVSSTLRVTPSPELLSDGRLGLAATLKLVSRSSHPTPARNSFPISPLNPLFVSSTALSAVWDMPLGISTPSHPTRSLLRFEDVVLGSGTITRASSAHPQSPDFSSVLRQDLARQQMMELSSGSSQTFVKEYFCQSFKAALNNY